MSNYEVAMEAAWLVRDVKETDDAIGVAVSEAGKRLNETDKSSTSRSSRRHRLSGLRRAVRRRVPRREHRLGRTPLEIDIFNADSEEHAERIAKSEVGGALRDVPLGIIEVIETDGDGTATATTSRISRAVRRRDRFDRRCDIGRRRNLF